MPLNKDTKPNSFKLNNSSKVTVIRHLIVIQELLIVILPSLQLEMLDAIYEGHLKIAKCQVQDTLYSGYKHHICTRL